MSLAAGQSGHPAVGLVCIDVLTPLLAPSPPLHAESTKDIADQPNARMTLPRMGQEFTLIVGQTSMPLNHAVLGADDSGTRITWATVVSSQAPCDKEGLRIAASI